MLHNYDPKEARQAIATINGIRIWRTGLLGLVKKFRWLIKSFVTSSFIDNFMTICVLFNTICLAIDRYGID